MKKTKSRHTDTTGQAATELNPPSPVSLLGESIAATRTSMFGEARHSYPVVEIRDLAASANDAMGKNDFAGALEYYRRCAEQEPHVQWYIYRIGECLFKLGSASESLRYLELAISLEPNFQWSYYYLALAQDALGNVSAAKQAIGKSLRLCEPCDTNIHIAGCRLLSASDNPGLLINSFEVLYEVEHLSDEAYFEVIEAWCKLCNNITHNVANDVISDQLVRLTELASKSVRGHKWWPIGISTAVTLAERDASKALLLLERSQDEYSTSEYRRFAKRIYDERLRVRITRLLNGYLIGSIPLDDQAGFAFLLCLADTTYSVFGDYALAERLVECTQVQLGSSELTATGLYVEILAARSAHYEVAQFLKTREELYTKSMRTFTAYVNAIMAIGQDQPILLCSAIERLIVTFAEITEEDELALMQGLRLMNRAVDAAFWTMMEQTTSLANAGDPVCALAIRERVLLSVAGQLARLEELRQKKRPVHFPIPYCSGHRRRVVLLGDPNLPQCYAYRVTQKVELLQLADFDAIDFACNDEMLPRIREALAGADAVLFARLPATPFVLRLMFYCRSLRVKVYYDIDDLIFDERYFPPPIETYGGSIDQNTFFHLLLDNPLFRIAMQQADTIIVSTNPLKGRIHEVLGDQIPVHVHRNMVGAQLAHAAERSGSIATERVSTGEAVTIFFGSGTKAHKGIFNFILAPVLRRLLSEHPNLRLVLMGPFEGAEEAWSGLEQWVQLLPIADYSSYIEVLSKSHINLSVLEETLAADCKSELKWFEAGIFGIPTVASPTENLRDVTSDNVDILYATGAEQWYQTLSQLCESPELRLNIGRAAHERIRGNYLWHRSSAELAGLFGVPTGSSRQRRLPVQHGQRSKRKRILFCNTFFWPQSIGGATRIVEGQLESLTRRYADEFDLFVLCANTEDDPTKSYLTEQYWFGSALVTCVNVPPRPWSDYQDEAIKVLVRRIILEQSIDLVHCHSLQLLTGSAFDGASELVPTVVTLHDAWWLSEHQFLTTPEGHVFQPAADFSKTGVDVRRRIALGRKLASASRLLAVSSHFAELYEAAGISKVGVNENGVIVPAVGRIFRDPEPKSLHIGFVGGISYHKGFHLFKAAFDSGDFERLEAVVVDHSRDFGYVRRTRWGSSTVRFIGKYPQSQIASLYQELDVLAAPSIWPESFGLVAREALMFGIPVIASDRGDIGRQIRPGYDGWRIDVQDERELARVLEHLNENPAAVFRGFDRPKYRTIDEQTDELVILYRDLLG